MKANDLVIEILSKLSGVPQTEITPEMELVADLGFDSPKALQLLV
jgi:acyl carrier protein